jgi:mRNA interferase RelE/StbE
MPDYRLEFDKAAVRAWKKLDQDTRRQFARKLNERLANPHVRGDKLSGLKDCYKIKLRSVGYRLVYQVIDQRLIVYVISIGRRDDGDTYASAPKRRR